MDWQVAQEWEQRWWGNCLNTYGEEQKQLLYADRMGLIPFHDGKSPYNFDLGGASVLDIGGGPASLLLKCTGFNGKVIDPLPFPPWVSQRYAAAGIALEQIRAEDMNKAGWDEAWIYNVLQHVSDPACVIANAQRAAKLIRIFEWIDTPTNAGHPHSLTARWLDAKLGGEGKVEQFNGQANCYGKAYYGVFWGKGEGGEHGATPHFTIADPDPKVYVVLGCKRGGTTFLAKMLSEGGVSIEDCNGYYEDGDFVLFNERIFEEAGGDWNDVPSDEDIARVIANHLNYLPALIEEKAEGKAMWGWKDPRQGVTIKYVLPHLEGNDVYLICVFRKPKKVAESIKRIWGHPIEKGEKIARTYYERILDAVGEFLDG